MFNLGDTAQEDQTVTFHDGNTAETFAVVVGVADERLLWFKDDFSGITGLEDTWVFNFSSTGIFLVDSPVDANEFGWNVSGSDVDDWAVTDLEFVRVGHNLDGGSESFATANGGVTFDDQDITSVRDVVLKTLDGHTDVVTWVSDIDWLSVHFEGEDLTLAREDVSVGWDRDDFHTWFQGTLFDATGVDGTDTLDSGVDARDWDTEWSVWFALWDFDELVEGFEESVDVDFLAGKSLDVATFVPWHVVGLFNQVVAEVAGEWDDWDLLLSERLGPASLFQHTGDFTNNFFEFFFRESLGSIGLDVHLVDTNNKLVDTEKVDQHSVLTRLTFNITVGTVLFF